MVFIDSRAKSGCAAKHLLKVIFRTNVSHEDEALEGLDVSTGGNHVNGYGDAGVELVAKRRKSGLGVLFGVISYLFAELVPAPEFFAHDVDDVIRVAICFGKDKRLGYFLATREHDRRNLVAELTDDGAYLGRVDDIAV